MIHKLTTMSFGEIVAKRRKQLGMNQTEASTKAVISRQYLYRIEKRKAKELNLSIAVLVRLAKALAVDPKTLFRIYLEDEEYENT